MIHFTENAQVCGEKCMVHGKEFWTCTPTWALIPSEVKNSIMHEQE
jgi:hypothetical protein